MQFIVLRSLTWRLAARQRTLVALLLLCCVYLLFETKSQTTAQMLVIDASSFKIVETPLPQCDPGRSQRDRFSGQPLSQQRKIELGANNFAQVIELTSDLYCVTTFANSIFVQGAFIKAISNDHFAEDVWQFMVEFRIKDKTTNVAIVGKRIVIN